MYKVRSIKYGRNYGGFPTIESFIKTVEDMGMLTGKTDEGTWILFDDFVEIDELVLTFDGDLKLFI
ncbi:MAG: hypothetical protein ACRCZ0_05095 [Cetobacterium sp.]